jgi:hypothetical protein
LFLFLGIERSPHIRCRAAARTSGGTHDTREGILLQTNHVRTLDSPQVIVEHILALFEAKGWLDILQETTPWLEISNVSPELEYWLEET